MDMPHRNRRNMIVRNVSTVEWVQDGTYGNFGGFDFIPERMFGRHIS
jgi:hypothetical protein